MTLSTPEGAGQPPQDVEGPEESAIRNYLVSEQGEVVEDIPAGVQQAWECSDASSLKDGQLTWSQASRLSGPAIFIPSLCVAVPTVEAPLDEATKQLQLAPAPWAAHYDQTPHPGAGSGNAIFASHVNYGRNAWGPFRLLRTIEGGAPIVARNADGSYHVYAEVDTKEYDQDQTPNVEGMFRNDGPETLTLITCEASDDEKGTLGRWRRFDDNLVVTAASVD